MNQFLTSLTKCLFDRFWDNLFLECDKISQIKSTFYNSLIRLSTIYFFSIKRRIFFWTNQFTGICNVFFRTSNFWSTTSWYFDEGSPLLINKFEESLKCAHTSLIFQMFCKTHTISQFPFMQRLNSHVIFHWNSSYYD